MNDARRKILMTSLQAFDLAALVCCFLFSRMAGLNDMESLTIEAIGSIQFELGGLVLFLLFAMVWHGLFAHFGLYSSRRLTTMWEDLRQGLKATTAGATVLFVAEVALASDLLTVLFGVLSFYVPVTLTVIGARLGLKFLLRRVRLYGRNLRYVLLVGTNERAMELAQRLEQAPVLGYRFIGFVDEPPGDEGFQASHRELVANLENLRDLLRNTVVDEVVICLPIETHFQQISQVVADCARQGITVRYLSDIFRPDAGYLRAEQYEEGTFISVRPSDMELPGLLAKRAVDFVGSLVLLVALSPLFVVVAVLIKLTSKGPIFFVQKRVGYNKRLFPLIKFRTMQVDAEARLKELEEQNEVQGPAFKMTNDPRVTPIGKMLRKTSIDELPQLFNVLVGDMSLVGPRPLPVRDYEGFSEDWHRRRFSVKPGMTCIWQISGRSNVSFADWMKMDIQYIDNWSLRLDLAILLGTIPAVMKGRGAR